MTIFTGFNSTLFLVMAVLTALAYTALSALVAAVLTRALNRKSVVE